MYEKQNRDPILFALCVYAHIFKTNATLYVCVYHIYMQETILTIYSYLLPYIKQQLVLLLLDR